MALILMILSFIWWWPLGLAVLALLLARGKFGGWGRPIYIGEEARSDWDRHSDHRMDRWERKMVRAQEKVERVRSRVERFYGRGGGWLGSSSSGNSAFDDYRADTLKRLEEEQHEFKEFLGRLRFAKDRAEFDQFMADRRQRPAEPGSSSDPSSPGPHG